MSEIPTVSAIVSTYNSEKFIRGRLDDLLEQTIMERMEIVIVNSGSLQNEDVIIKEYIHKYSNIKYIKTENRETIYQAWNRGIKISTGKFITSSNTDDRLKSDAFEILSNTLINEPELMMVYADQYLSYIPNQLFSKVNKNNLIKYPDYKYIYQLERCIIGSQPMWRASLHFKENIWFDEKYEVCGDHEFELRISGKYKIKHLSVSLGTFYKSPEKSNKEFQDPYRTRKEVIELTNLYLCKYVNDCSHEKLIEILYTFRKMISIPILIYELIKRIESILFPGIYPSHNFHSIEFIYYLNIIIYEKNGNIKKCLKLCEKFLRYKKSEKINQKYLQLTMERN